MIRKIKYVEMHVTHTCNLNCMYCSHYCDIGYSGAIGFDQGRQWLEQWSSRIFPTQIRLLGGEPLLHPDLAKYIVALKELYPKSKRTVVTNGLLLRKWEETLPLFISTGTRLNISSHYVPERSIPAMEDALKLMDVWQKRGLVVTVQPSHSNWFLTYQGRGVDAVPFGDGDAEKSFRFMCETPEKVCTTLHQGKLWKCPQLAYLPLIFDRLTNPEPWRKYLAYRPLPPDAPDEELEAFFSWNTEFCDICPAFQRPAPAEEMRAVRGGMAAVADADPKSRKRWRNLNKARLWIREAILRR